MDCHTVCVYVGCGGGFVYSEHAPSYLWESYTVLLSRGFFYLLEVFYLASANQPFPPDYRCNVEKYKWKLWVCTTLEPDKTLPQQVPGETALLQSWRELTVGGSLGSPFSPAILPLPLCLHLMFSPLQDVFRLKHGCSQGLNWGSLPSWVCWWGLSTLSVLIFSCSMSTQCHPLLCFHWWAKTCRTWLLILCLHFKDPFVLCD